MSRGKMPSSVLILGAGCFGLGTAYALAKHPDYRDTIITIVDRSDLPASDGSSVDSSRIVRADYSDLPYAKFAVQAQEKWRHTWWGKDSYHEQGLVLAETIGPELSAASTEMKSRVAVWLDEALRNQRAIGRRDEDVQYLDSRAAFGPLFTQPDGTSSVDNSDFAADVGYINHLSGWVNAERAMRNLYQKIKALERVRFIKGKVERLLFSGDGDRHTARGAVMSSGEHIQADVTILATGAWTPSLIDMRGIASATGQPLAYIALTPEEQPAVGDNPTILNQSSGLFIITPSDNVLKVARHGHGYANRTTIHNPEPNGCRGTGSEEQDMTVSLPWTSWDADSTATPSTSIPAEAEDDLRSFLRATYPSLADRPFLSTRLCWYLDTASSDFIVDWHPRFGNLFVATGGSGHAFKFAPVLGDAVVKRMRGVPGEEVGFGLDGRWAWPTERKGEADGHVWAEQIRGGRLGMELRDEMAKGRSS